MNSLKHSHTGMHWQPAGLQRILSGIPAMGKTYTDRVSLSETAQAELSEKIASLCRLTRNRNLARENCIDVRVTYFVPCTDPANPSFRIRGSYQITEGICQKVDLDESCTLQVNDTYIPIQDILSIDLKGQIPDNPFCFIALSKNAPLPFGSGLFVYDHCAAEQLNTQKPFGFL